MRKLLPALVVGLFVLSVANANGNAKVDPPGGQGKGLGVGHGIGNPGAHGAGGPAVVVPGTGTPPGLVGKAPAGLAKQGKVPHGWTQGNAWWKTPGALPQPLTVRQIHLMTTEDATEALARLKAVTNPTPRQLKDISRLEAKLNKH